MNTYKPKKTYDLFTEVMSKKETHGAIELEKIHGISARTIRRWFNGYETILPDGRVINNSSSILNTVTTEELQHAFDVSTSISSVIRFFGLDVRICYHQMLKTRIENENISLINMKINSQESIMYREKKTIEQIFVKDSQTNMHTIKRLILKYGLIEYKCCECKNEGTHNDKPLVLQIDHIDGDNKNNSLDNLRYMCPNCHSQTPTFTGRNQKKDPNKKENNVCLDCGKPISPRSTFCPVCHNKPENQSQIKIDYNLSKRKFNPNIEELSEMVTKYPLTVVGRHYGVADNAIKKRCIILGIDYKELRKLRDNK